MCVVKVFEKDVEMKIIARQLCIHDMIYLKGLTRGSVDCEFCGWSVDNDDYVIQVVIGGNIRLIFYVCKYCMKKIMGQNYIEREEECRN